MRIASKIEKLVRNYGHIVLPDNQRLITKLLGQISSIMVKSYPQTGSGGFRNHEGCIGARATNIKKQSIRKILWFDKLD
jgi:hypothetical protein